MVRIDEIYVPSKLHSECLQQIYRKNKHVEFKQLTQSFILIVFFNLRVKFYSKTWNKIKFSTVYN